MQTLDFQEGVEYLCQLATQQGPAAVMCAEAVRSPVLCEASHAILVILSMVRGIFHPFPSFLLLADSAAAVHAAQHSPC